MLIIPTEKRFDWKHAPIVLFILVILNIIIFFGYQFNDNEKEFNAVMKYRQLGFLEKEWPIFEKYLESINANSQLESYRELYQQMDNETTTNLQQYPIDLQLISIILTEDGFYEYLDANAYNAFYVNFLEKWETPRREINSEIQSISSLSFGLIPNKISLTTLISHQFLHGSTMHLLGNMFFLIICGFAVEAAIGHLRFLSYYLISGIVAGGLFSLMDLSSTIPLVGASGAISGVMAMYLGIFRFKKIEFFYWFFIFVGYLRAPAMLILPFYIGKELYDYYYNTGSNVAFMAHAGGFVTGALLIAATYLISPQSFNQEYIEEDQDLPQEQKDLAVVYDNISKFRLSTASNKLDTFIEKYKENFDLNLLKFNLLTIQNEKTNLNAFKHLLTMNKLQAYQLDKLEELWINNQQHQSQLSLDDLYKFGWNMTNSNNLGTAETVFNRLNKLTIKHPSLAMFARKLSVIFGKLENQEKQQEYNKIADSLT